MQRLLTVPESARLAHRSRRWLNGKIERGEGPHAIKLGRRFLIAPDAFSAWLDSHATTGGNVG